MTKHEKYSYEKVCILKNMRYNVFRVMKRGLHANGGQRKKPEKEQK